MFSSVITKNLNWDILTKNSVTFKRWDEVKDEKFDYYSGSLKNPIFREGVNEKPIYRGWGVGGGLLKRGTWAFCRFKGEGLVKKRMGVYLRKG